MMRKNEEIGTASMIVSILKEYPTEIPVGFVASRMSTSLADLEKDLMELESKQVIRRNKDLISLIRK